MKRALLLLVFLAVFSSTAHAATRVTGVVMGDVNWNKAGSPYQVQGAVSVPPGSTLTIGPGAQVMIEGGSGLEVQGALKVQGAAADPAVFHMMAGGLNSYLLLSGAKADILNAKFLGGAFVVRDSELRLEACEVAKGSGVYLQGTTAADIRSNKIYGNATGITLDGTVELDCRFNTLVQNTYGLQIKDFNNLVFTNNSVHDNQQYDVVNRSKKAAPLGGNYWGVENWSSLKPKVQGESDFDPLKSLKDVLRSYVKTMLPDLPASKAVELRKQAAKDAEAARLGALAVKKRRAEIARKERLAAVAAKAPAGPEGLPPDVKIEIPEAAKAALVAEVPSVAAAPPAAIAPPAAAMAPIAALAPAVAEAEPAGKVETMVMPTAPSGKSVVVALPDAAHALKPLTGLPPAQSLPGEIPASSGQSAMSGIAPAPEAAPAVAAPAAAPAAMPEPPADMTIPDLGDEFPPMDNDMTLPPAPGGSDQAPPPDLGGLELPPPESAPPAAATPPPAPASGEPPALDGLDLPPMQDIDVAPPKDLDLPPMDDSFPLD